MANFFRSVLLRLQNKTVTAGTSASSVTKDSGYDGLGTVTINPTPSETKTQAAGTSNIDVTPTSGKLLSKVTVTPTPTETKSATPSTTAQTITPSSGKYLSSVSVGAISTQTKSATPSTSAQTITPDSGKYLTSVSISAISTETKSQAAGTSDINVTPTSGKYLTKVTITPQQHSDSFTPTANLKGASGNANDMGAVHNKRFVDTSGMIVPSGNKSITANGTGIDVKSYSTVSVNVPHPTHTTTYTPAANKSNNDMGATHSYRYVDTSGMIVPSGTKDNSSSPYTSNGTYTVTGLDSYTGVKLAVNVPNPTLSGNATTDYVYPGKTFYSNSYTKQTGTMTTKAAATYNTSTSDQTISAGQYLTGAQTIKAVTTSGISAANIKSGSVIKVGDANSATRIANVTGTFTSSSTVSSGQTAAGASQIKSGYSAWVNGSEVKGSYVEPTINEIDPREEVRYSFSPNEIIKNVSSYSGVVLPGINLIVPSNNNPPRVNPEEGYWIQDQEGYVVDSISVPSPSNSSPATMTYPNIYQLPANTTGYLISSYQSKTPSTSGVSFNSGMVKMSSGGYAYSSKPTPYLKEEATLWTNSSPTSAMSNGTTVTLSNGGISSYDYIKINFRLSTTITTSSYVMVDKATMIASTATNGTPQVAFGGPINTGNQYFYLRRAQYVSNTQIKFTDAGRFATAQKDSKGIIPTSIVGYKFALQ